MKAFLHLLLFLGVAGGFHAGFSQTTVGPNNPSAAADGGGGSGSTPAWNFSFGTPYTSDNGYALVVNQNKSKNSSYLHVTGFGFAIPVGSYITGITVEVEMYGAVEVGAQNTENSVLLINATGTRVGNDQSTFATIATADPNSYVTYGGSSDNWGGALTYADINSPNFGVALQYRSGNLGTPGNYNFYVDHVRVRVTYTPAFDAVVNGCFNNGATWGRVSPGVAGIDYPDATIAASIPGGRTVTVCTGTTANCYALIMNSNFSTTTGAVLTVADATASLNVADDILMLTTTAASGNFAAGTINLTGGTITVTDALLMTADRNGGSGTTQSIVFGGGTLTVNGNVTMNGDDVTATTRLNMTAANSVFNLGGDISFGTGASLTNGTGATGTVNYKGAGSQIIRSAINYFNLTFSGGGVKNLEASTIVRGTLNMTSGNCNMGGVLTLTLGVSTVSRGTLSYTSGTLYSGTFLRWFDTATIAEGAVTGLFPVGSATDYRPFYVYFPITGPSAGGTLSVSHSPLTGVATVSFIDGAFTVVRRTNMSWLLTAASGFSTAVGSLNTRIEGTNIGQVGNVNDLRVTLAGGVIGTAGTNGGTTANPIVKRLALPAFTASSNTFYIGSVDAISSPLPIELVYFKAQVVEDAVHLTWETASELNNDYFTVERSATGEVFSSIGEIHGKGTTNEANKYVLKDTNPIYGTSYYRLKQTDFDGTFTYSKIVAVNFEGPSVPFLNVYPNPSNGNEITIEVKGLKNIGEIPVVIYDQMGKECYNFILKNTENSGAISQHFVFDRPIADGIYLVRAGSTLSLTKRLVVVNGTRK